MYDFPASPTEGQEYTPPVGGQTYIYASPRWLVKGVPPTGGGGSTGIGEAPEDGKQYGRQSAAWSEVLANPTWATLSGKPSTFPPTLPIAWTDVSGKPSTFPPSTHSHPQSEVTNLVTDLSLKAPLASPALTGTPTAPTASTADNTTKIATTAYVKAQGYATTASLTGYAPIADPTFTGDPKAPTPATADNDTSIATTAFVKAQGYIPAAPTDGFTYGRQSGAWVRVVDSVTYTANLEDLWSADAAFTDAINSLTTRVTTLEGAGYVTEAPNDGQQYARQDLGWHPIDIPDTVPTTYIGDTPPVAPEIGQLWWESDSGKLYIRYFDGDTTQWVETSGAPQLPAPLPASFMTWPAGVGVDWWGPTAPEGTLFCYGQAVSRLAYAALFEAIGITHGAGNGATTFNLPDCRGRVAAGKDDMGGTNAARLPAAFGTALGGAGGAHFHPLVIGEMPSHQHTTSTQAANVLDYSSASKSRIDLGAGSVLGGTLLTGIVTGFAGSGSNHNNTQPTIICNKCITTGGV